MPIEQAKPAPNASAFLTVGLNPIESGRKTHSANVVSFEQEFELHPQIVGVVHNCVKDKLPETLRAKHSLHTLCCLHEYSKERDMALKFHIEVNTIGNWCFSIMIHSSVLCDDVVSLPCSDLFGIQGATNQFSD